MNAKRGKGFLVKLDGRGKAGRWLVGLKILLIISLMLWNMGPAIGAIAAEVGSGDGQVSTEQSAAVEPAPDTEAAPEVSVEETAPPAEEAASAPADGTEPLESEPAVEEQPTPESLEPAASPQYMAYVGTDKSDYGPGQTVIITGSGYAPGEEVRIIITNADDAIVHEATVIATAEGMVSDTYVIPADGSASYAYLLTATGLTSGASAQTRFTDASAVFITAPTILQAPGASGYTDEKAIPLEGIVGIEIVSASALPGDAQAQLFRQNGDAFADFFIDGAATQPVTGGVFDGSQWHYWVYWNIEKVDPLAADIGHYDQFRAEVTGTLLTTIYAPGPTAGDWVSINVDNRSSLNDSSLDFAEGAPSAITANIGDTFQIRAKYQESSTINALGIEAYYDATCIKLIGTHIYWYDTSVDPGSIATGIPGGYTQAWHDMPWIDPTPANVSANDWWVTAYDFEVLDTCAFFISPYIETRRQTEGGGTQWKMDSGFNEVIAPGAIEGYKFNDLNGNGIWDNGEPPLEGWTIFIDMDEDGNVDVDEPLTVTDVNGYYAFSNVWPGTYDVWEFLQTGWVNTTGNPQSAVVVSQETTRVDFGNMEDEGSISGYKYNDLNGNGVWDNGEPPLEGWTITADDGQNMGSDVTDVNGAYTIEGLQPGSYTVYETLQAGWTQTEPANGDPYNGVVVLGGQDTPDVNFGNFENVMISGYKFEDQNANGVWDMGEPPLENWTINCTDQAPTMTDATGYYQFIDLGPGTYTISETLQNGWVQTTPTNPNDYTIEVQSGQDETDNNFGNYKIQYRISVTPDGNTNQVEDMHVFTILLEKNLGMGWVPADGEEVSYSWSGVGSIVSPVSPQMTDPNGEIDVTVQSNDPGSGTLTAYFMKEAAGGDIDISASADKMWIAYRISVTPDRSTNQVGDEHIFTILLEKDEGFGWVSADNEEVSFSWLGVGSIVTPTSPQMTDANGQIDVTVQSSDPGSGTLTADFMKDTDGSTIDISDSGDKTWIEYRISVTPDGETNLAGDEHTFTILLEKDEGSGWVPAAGESVDFSWMGVGSIVSPTSPQITDANGEIDVNVQSSDPGSGTLTATFEKQTDSSMISETDSATKNWINYRISVTPDGETNQVGDEHIFTILLEKDEGQGWVPADGESVDFSWMGVGSIVTPTSPQITDVDGKVYVTVMSNTPGSGTLTANFITATDGSVVSIFDTATKYWIEYRITVTPDGNTNASGDSHMFTILLEKNEGSGWVPADNESVDFSWMGVGSIVSPTSPQITDANGEIDVNIQSSDPGSGTLTATFEKETDGSTIMETASADKNWLSYRISVTPDGETNQVGDEHVFTILLEKNLGQGWMPAMNEEVTYNFSGVGFIVTPTSPQMTDGNGEVHVTVMSNTPGSGTLTAYFSTETDGSLITVSDSAIKSWIEYRISVTPDASTNQVGDDHIFTILLEKNEGSGWMPADGESVDFSWMGVGSIVSPTSPWITDANGEIDVTVSSLTPGLGTLTASFMQTTDGSTIQEEGTGTKLWIDYQISVTPDTATNDIGVGHIFTITLLKDTGEGWEPADGESVSFSLGGVGTILAPPSPAITDANGQIFVLINSDDAGTSTLTAMFILETDGSTITRSDSGDKIWIGGTIEGFKFNDRNANGKWEPELGEEALPGWTIDLGQLVEEDINVLATTVTDENGHYIFENVSQGSYVVFEIMQDAWASTTLSIQDAIIISQEQMNVRIDFGNQAQGVIIGQVCNDLNRNGIHDPGEPLLTDWVITLYEADGVTMLAQTTTDENGNFMFDNLTPGTYVVTETLIGPDWINTTPISLTVTLVWNGEEGQFFARADFCNVLEFLPFTPEVLPFTGGHAVSNNAANSTQSTSSPAAGWRNLFAGLLLFSLGATLLWLGLPSGRRYQYHRQNASR